ncbi:hypothetical protein EB796_022274 [Bugula neritina]|uniref:Uncharacterized protein n=1 Tax=Bugula neritina TaxID=10212 RepID=A0A7J7J0S1_BUGNE|nr:hypothetical protein EB796_022274 [Bugula neritina]
MRTSLPMQKYPITGALWSSLLSIAKLKTLVALRCPRGANQKLAVNQMLTNRQIKLMNRQTESSTPMTGMAFS